MTGTLKIGDKIHNYEVVRVLGKSDIATVYLAKDQVQNRKWIIKEMVDPVTDPEKLEEFKNRFIYICKQLSEIKHKSIPRIVDFFVENDRRYYLVREYLEGRFLQDFMERQRHHLSEDQVKSWALQIFDMIEYLHSQNPPIIMGVIIPKNLMISPLGKIRIKDLGLDRFFSLEKQKDLLFKVSPGYTAPEIVRLNKAPDFRSDIYSLGAILYFLLSRVDPNKNPYGFKNLSEYRTDISEQTRKSIMKALSQKPEDRYDSIREFRNDLLKDIVKKRETRIDCSVDKIAADNAPSGKLIQGSFNIKNLAEGQMEGVIFAEYSWLKIHPTRFRTNDVDVKFWIDTAYMQPESVQENTITIQTPEEKLIIPVKVTIAPGFVRSLKAFPASIILLFIPLAVFAVIEAFRNYLLKNAWDILIIKSDLTRKTIDFVLKNKKFLIKKMSYQPGTVFLSKLYALLIIFMPYLVPMFLGKIREQFNRETKKSTIAPALLAMVMPTILLVSSMFVNFVPMEITANADMKYLDPTRYLALFVGANILTTIMMLAPKDVQGRSFIDRNNGLKILFYSLLTIYFVVAIVFLVIH